MLPAMSVPLISAPLPLLPYLFRAAELLCEIEEPSETEGAGQASRVHSTTKLRATPHEPPASHQPPVRTHLAFTTPADSAPLDAASPPQAAAAAASRNMSLSPLGASVSPIAHALRTSTQQQMAGAPDDTQMHDEAAALTSARRHPPSAPHTPAAQPPSLAALQAAASFGPLHLPLPLAAPAPASDWSEQSASDRLLLARSYFDLREFQRAAHALRHLTPLPVMPAPPPDSAQQALQRASPNTTHHQSLFLRCYSLYLAGEKRKEEELVERGGGSAGIAGGSATAKASSSSHHGAAGSSGARRQANGGPASTSADEAERHKILNRELRGLQSTLASVLVRSSDTLASDGTPLVGSPYESCLWDGHLWFVYGLVLRELGLRSAARNALLLSVATFPFNWSAWTALRAFVNDRTQLEHMMLYLHQRAQEQQACAERQHAALMAEAGRVGSAPPAPLPPYPSGVWMKDFFYVDCLLNLQQQAPGAEDDSLTVLDQLHTLFPHALHVRTAQALSYYHKRAFPESQYLFAELHASDPYRLAHLDTYSNILFVFVETCAIVGNYYSMRGEHERAILFFQRALTLDPAYLSAWTLMGHEYIELRCTNKAIECYRKALDINNMDYRAWYGLGQTYEILCMNAYSLYYFKQACAIKPHDPRMWCAMGEGYEKLATGGALQARLDDAIRCYQRAVAEGAAAVAEAGSGSADDADGLALHKLAKLYRRRGQLDTAAEYYKRVLQRHCGPDEGLGGGAAELLAEDAAAASAGTHSASDAALPLLASTPVAAAPSASLHLPGRADPLHQDAIDAMLFLAHYYRQRAHYAQAEAYCNRLIDHGGGARDAAKSLLLEIRQLKAHAAAAAATAGSHHALHGNKLHASLLTPSGSGGNWPSTRLAPPSASATRTPASVRTPLATLEPSQAASPSDSFFRSP